MLWREKGTPLRRFVIGFLEERGKRHEKKGGG